MPLSPVVRPVPYRPVHVDRPVPVPAAKAGFLPQLA
jgi:hypothetical protein